ncbi:EI2BA factor, partial [Ptilorrhoa leucosticta]|nr:EI2BA factor [Ptilorrhoa leucosticta]
PDTPRCLSDLIETFRAQLRDDPDVASAVAAIRALLGFLKQDRGGSGPACSSRRGGDPAEPRLSPGRGPVTLLTKVKASQGSAKVMCEFFFFWQRILTHAYSRVVLRVLEAAVESKKRFSVYVTESQPDQAGQVFINLVFILLNIPVTVILDAAVGYIMEKVDLVLVGAEGVVESGGIINKIGTNQIAVCAKAQNKPFYVVAESFKFVRLFPLNQQDVPDRFKYKADTLETGQNLTEEHPWIDYTSPSLITLLFTDLGVLTPSAVSDELIKLYL